MRDLDLIGMSIAALARPATWSPSVDITIPVYNEERDLAPAVRRLHNEIATWVSQNFAAVTVDGVTIYDLTAPNS